MATELAAILLQRSKHEESEPSTPPINFTPKIPRVGKRVSVAGRLVLLDYQENVPVRFEKGDLNSLVGHRLYHSEPILSALGGRDIAEFRTPRDIEPIRKDQDLNSLLQTQKLKTPIDLSYYFELNPTIPIGSRKSLLPESRSEAISKYRSLLSRKDAIANSPVKPMMRILPEPVKKHTAKRWVEYDFLKYGFIGADHVTYPWKPREGIRKDDKSEFRAKTISTLETDWEGPKSRLSNTKHRPKSFFPQLSSSTVAEEQQQPTKQSKAQTKLPKVQTPNNQTPWKSELALSLPTKATSYIRRIELLAQNIRRATSPKGEKQYIRKLAKLLEDASKSTVYFT
jgi:hypothetical protein